MKDWIREDKEGRFHLKKVATGEWKLHYDTWGDECNHYSIPMPFKVNKEIVRLKGIAKNKNLHEQENNKENP